MSPSQRIADRFVITNPEQDLLGRGSMGDVYRATDAHTGEPVAVKALDPRAVARDPGILERFVREGEALRQLDHPNIVRMIAAVEEQGRHCLVMEYVEGGSLRDVLEKEGRLPVTRAVEIALELSDALTRAHHLGILHRDLKPENVLLATDGTPRLADFGLAHLPASSRLTQSGMLMGTVDYVSPEACNGEAPDERSDIWSFGVLLFEMLAGRVPFTGDTLIGRLNAIVTQPIPDLGQLAPGVPDELADLVYRMLDKDAGQRIPSVRMVGTELEAIQKGRHRGDKVTPKPTPPSGLPAFLEQGSEIEPPIFVSRENELALLDRFLNHALKGRGQVAFITGDPGQGKTALAQAFARQAQTAHPSLVVASGNCNAYTGIGDPYLPFREILGLLIGDIESLQQTGALSQMQARQLWRIFPLTVQAVVESGNHLVDIFVPGATLLQRAAGATGWPGKEVWLPQLEQLVARKAALSGEPNIQQTALFEQYSRVMRSLAQQYPLLLIVDDLQWADVGSINLLCQLGKRLEASRILVIGLYRSSEVALGREGQRHPLEPVLNELRQQFGENQIDVGQSEGRPFVDAFLDSEPNRLGEEFRLALFRCSGGHPLTTIELLSDLQERGGLVRDADGRWVEGPALNWESLPVRVEAMIAERMGRLGERELSVLRVASVQGETFSAEVVGRVVEVEEGEMIRCLSGVLDRRHRLVSAQGIRRSNGQRISSYRFRHILFQKYLYNSLDAVERSHLHQAVGSALQALYGQESVEIAVELARHFQEAGTVGQAADYLSQAGDRASHLVAYAEAIRHYEQARSAYERAYGSGWSPLERAGLERKMAEAQFRRGEHAQAVEHLERALGYLGQPVPATRWRLRLAIVHEIAVQIAHRLFSRWLVKPIGGPVDPLAVEAVSCFEPLGWIEVMMNADRFLYLTLRALNLSEHSGYGHGIVDASAGFGIILQFLGLLKLAGGYGQRSLKVGETIQDSTGLSFAYFGLSMLRLSEGDLQGGITFADKSAQIGRREDDLRQWGMGQNLISACLLYQGRLAECASAVQDMLRAGQEGGDQTVECWGLSKMGHQLWKTGRLDEAVTNLEACIKLAEAIPDLKFRVEAGAGLGRSLLRLGKLDQALSVLEDACERNRRNPQGGGMREGLAVAVAEAYVAAAEQSAPRERKSWLRKARRACRDAMKASWTARHRKPEVLLLRGQLAWITNRPAAAVRDWQRSLALAEAAGQQFDLGRVHLEMGRRLGDREHLERAEAILAEIGAAWDLACAHEALGKLSDQT
jgi:serine/threonine protein kinase/tetratricopeptide (TPR) repeat protein